MCELDPRLSVFDRMSEDEMELYNLMTDKFKNKGAKDTIYLLDGYEHCSTMESWQIYKEAFKKLVETSQTWKAFKKELKKLDKLLVSNGINW